MVFATQSFPHQMMPHTTTPSEALRRRSHSPQYRGAARCDEILVEVQTANGGSFSVQLGVDEEGDASHSPVAVAVLKSEIAKVTCVVPVRQQLFASRNSTDTETDTDTKVATAVGSDDDDHDDVQEPLPDDHPFVASCAVILVVLAQPEWFWDVSEQLLPSSEELMLFRLSGPDECVATKMDEYGWDNCLQTEPAMEVGTGSHTISVQIPKEGSVYCGVVSDGTPRDECNFYHIDPEKERPDRWFEGQYGKPVRQPPVGGQRCDESCALRCAHDAGRHK